jgi:hypothetical protein
MMSEVAIVDVMDQWFRAGKLKESLDARITGRLRLWNRPDKSSGQRKNAHLYNLPRHRG